MSINDEVIVEILDDQAKEKSGTFKDDEGNEREYTTRKQEARIEFGGYVQPYQVRVEVGVKPFPKGRYRMNLRKMMKVNNEALAFSKYAVLEPLQAVK